MNDKLYSPASSSVFDLETTPEQLKKVKAAQQLLIGIIMCLILLTVVMVVLSMQSPKPTDNSVFIIPWIALEAIGLWCVYRLAAALDLTALLWVVGMLIPYVNLVCLFRLNKKANSFFEKHGVSVGLFGAKFP